MSVCECKYWFYITLSTYCLYRSPISSTLTGISTKWNLHTICTKLSKLIAVLFSHLSIRYLHSIDVRIRHRCICKVMQINSYLWSSVFYKSEGIYSVWKGQLYLWQLSVNWFYLGFCQFLNQSSIIISSRDLEVERLQSLQLRVHEFQHTRSPKL